MMKTVVFLLVFVPEIILHPIHVAVTDIVYNTKTKSMEITHKIFIDDIEKHIESIYKSRGKIITLKFNTAKEDPRADEYLKEYLDTYFKLKINGKVYSSQYVGKEYETDAVWLYAEIPKLKSPGQIEITNALLMDLHEDQDNLVHIKVEDAKKSLRFNRREQAGIVKF